MGRWRRVNADTASQFPFLIPDDDRLIAYNILHIGFFQELAENDYPFKADVYQGMERVRAKPFSQSFDKQVDAANQLYGSFLKLSFPWKHKCAVYCGGSVMKTAKCQQCGKMLVERLG